MTQNKKIAVTGGIGSGKSQLCAYFKKKGFSVFSCDEIYREMLGEREYLTALSRTFPDCFQSGTLDKAALSRLVFSDAEAKQKLDALAHPLIMERLMQKMAGCAVSFAEVPLLFEGGFEPLFDYVIAVKRKEETRVESVRLRDGLSREEVLSRIQSQCNEDIYKQKNCIVAVNDGTRQELEQEGERILKLLNLN